MRAVIARATSLDPVGRYASVRDLKLAFSETADAGGASDDVLNRVVAPSAVPATARSGERFTVLGRVWNVAVVAVLAMFLGIGLTYSLTGPS